MAEDVDAQVEALLRQHPGKAARVVPDAAALARALFYERHVDDVIVLRGGLKALGLEASVRRDVRAAARRGAGIAGFVRELGEEAVDRLDGRVYYWNTAGRERTLKRDRDGKLLRTLGEKLRSATDFDDPDAPPAERAVDGAEAGVAATGGLYIAELSRTRKRKHPCTLDERSRTLLSRDAQDVLSTAAVCAMPSWDRGHVFVGAAGTGSSVHVDQVNWSNLGKNFLGRKLLAVWPLGAESERVLSSWYRRLMRPAGAPTGPLPAEALAELEAACRVAIVEPGDVFVFSGANAHTTLCLPPAHQPLGAPAVAQPRATPRRAADGGRCGRGVSAQQLAQPAAQPEQQAARGARRGGGAQPTTRGATRQAREDAAAPPHARSEPCALPSASHAPRRAQAARARAATSAARAGPPAAAPARAAADVLNLTAYESFINLNAHNLRAFLQTGTAAHHPECAMCEDELLELKEDVAHRLHAALQLLSAHPGTGGADGRGGAGCGAAGGASARSTRRAQREVARLREPLLAAVHLLRSDDVISGRMRTLERRRLRGAQIAQPGSPAAGPSAPLATPDEHLGVTYSSAERGSCDAKGSVAPLSVMPS